MKIKTKSNRKKLFAISLLGAVLVLGGGSLAYYQFGRDSDNGTQQSSEQANDNTVDGTPSSDSPKLPAKGSDTSTSEDNKTSKENESASSSDNTQADTSSPSNSNIEKPVIERASQSGSNIRVVATLQRSTTGICNATFTKQGFKPIVKASNVSVGPSYYMCSFSVPVSELPDSGQWSLRITHNSNGKSAISDEQILIIEKN